MEMTTQTAPITAAKTEPTPRVQQNQICGISKPKIVTQVCGENSESVFYKGKKTFLWFANQQLKFCPAFSQNGHQVTPTVPQIGFFTLENLPKILSIQELFDGVYRNIDPYIDAPKEYKYVASLAVLLSYQQNKLNVVPYIELFGAPETGKSDFLWLISTLSYYGLFSTDLPSADIYGFLDSIKPAIGTICEDESQGLERDPQKLKIWKAGYQRDNKILRTDMQPLRTLRSYEVFCLKCLGGEKQVKDEALRSRVISLRMLSGKPKKNLKLERPEKEKINEIKGNLLAWKLATAKEPLPKVETPFINRTREIWEPLLQIALRLKQFDEILAFAKQTNETKGIENETERDARIYAVVKDFVDEKFKDAGNAKTISITFADIWNRLKTELGGGTTYSEILNQTPPSVMETEDYGQLSKESVGLIIGARFPCHKTDQKIEGKTQRVYIFQRLAG